MPIFIHDGKNNIEAFSRFFKFHLYHIVTKFI